MALLLSNLVTLSRGADIPDGYSREILQVKFRPGTNVKPPEALLTQEMQASVRSISRLFSLPEERLDALRIMGEMRAEVENLPLKTLPDLNLWFQITLNPGVDAERFIDALSRLESVEIVQPAPLPQPPPAVTPDFTGNQGYLGPATDGIDALFSWIIPGGNGCGTKIYDVEYSWNQNHEDLGKAFGVPLLLIPLDSAVDPFADNNHGTAVLGEVIATNDFKGVTGISWGADVGLAPANTALLGYNPANAILLAVADGSAGDVILIEQQTGVCGLPGPCSNNCGPTEWIASVFNAIQTAVANGFVVVEAAGNGNVNLDQPACGGYFDRNIQDSGAIIVGAGGPPGGSDRQRLGFSSYGSRVDVQGWGGGVMTTGYGSSYVNPDDPLNPNFWYTSGFGGTSSASPIVTGAVTNLEGISLIQNGAPINAFAVRNLLVTTGSPQLGNLAEHIGPRPDLLEALRQLGIGIICPDSITNNFQPPNPWVQEGLVIETICFGANTDLYNLHFFSDALQCSDVPCEPGDVKKIHEDMVEFVPEEIAFVPVGETVFVEVKISIPIGQHACTYEGEIHAIAETFDDCLPKVSNDYSLSLTVRPVVDMDVDDNHGNVSDNVLTLKGAKGNLVSGTFTIVNPNSEVKNVDLPDGPGNIRIEPVSVSSTDLTKIGDPGEEIPSGSISFSPRSSLGAGEAQDITVSVDIPDGIPINAIYTGTVTVNYRDCNDPHLAPQILSSVSDEFTLEVEVLPTQGPLDIVETSLSEDFCPPDPWTQVGQVEFSFDIEALGDHRNIRLSSGGLRHDSLDKKLDDFNFFPNEIAFLAAGETREVTVIVKVPIGQHSGTYTGDIVVVSENGGEDSVEVTVEVCPLHDMDIKDDYANVSDNIMEIQAISRANSEGSEWTLRAFDIGLPNELVNNHDEYDGPGNTEIDCISCTFAEWSPVWHEDDHDHHFHTNFIFTGEGYVIGEECDWRSGEWKRMFVGLNVPPMRGTENHPGTYKGRLDCFALSNGDTVDQDFFDVVVKLARIVGPPLISSNFGGDPTEEGIQLYWGDFTDVGLTGQVTLYREDPETGNYLRVPDAPVSQKSVYLDKDVMTGIPYNYKLGIADNGKEITIGPLTVGGVGRTPTRFGLFQNAPNPFSQQTAISYQLSAPSHTTLKIYDLTGRLVRTLVDEEKDAGVYTVGWNRKDDLGRELSNGVYFYRLTAGGFVATRKMVVLR